MRARWQAPRSNPEFHGRDSGLLRRFGPRNDDSIYNPHREGADAADEVRIEPLRRAHDLKAKTPLQDFCPENSQLLLGEPVADTAVDAGAKRQMLPRFCAIDDELVGALNLFFVAISRDVPHHHLVAFGYS